MLDAGRVTVLPADAARPDGDGAVDLGPDFGVSVETMGSSGGLSVDIETVVQDASATSTATDGGSSADARAQLGTELDPALKQHEDDGCVSRMARHADIPSHLAMWPSLGVLVLMLRRGGRARTRAAT